VSVAITISLHNRKNPDGITLATCLKIPNEVVYHPLFLHSFYLTKRVVFKTLESHIEPDFEIEALIKGSAKAQMRRVAESRLTDPQPETRGRPGETSSVPSHVTMTITGHEKPSLISAVYLIIIRKDRTSAKHRKRQQIYVLKQPDRCTHWQRPGASSQLPEATLDHMTDISAPRSPF